MTSVMSLKLKVLGVSKIHPQNIVPMNMGPLENQRAHLDLHVFSS